MRPLLRLAFAALVVFAFATGLRARAPNPGLNCAALAASQAIRSAGFAIRTAEAAASRVAVAVCLTACLAANSSRAADRNAASAGPRESQPHPGKASANRHQLGSHSS